MLSKKLREKLLSERASYPDDPFDGGSKFRRSPAEQRDSTTAGDRGSRPGYKNGHLTARELDMLRVFTSPEWSKGPSPGAVVNVQLLEDGGAPADRRGEQPEEDYVDDSGAEPPAGADRGGKSPVRETGDAAGVGW